MAQLGEHSVESPDVATLLVRKCDRRLIVTIQQKQWLSLQSIELYRITVYYSLHAVGCYGLAVRRVQF